MRRIDGELAEALAQRVAVDPQQAGCPQLVSSGLAQDGGKQRSLQRGNGFAAANPSGCKDDGVGQGREDLLRQNGKDVGGMQVMFNTTTFATSARARAAANSASPRPRRCRS